MSVSAVSYGGGVNSTALLLGLGERRETPTFILFADTGGELEETYDYLRMFSEYCKERFGFRAIRTIHRNNARHATLEDECLNLQTLPSLAFGFRGCSVKWKRQPMDRWLRHKDACRETWKRGELVSRLIGIHFDEQHRGQIDADGEFDYRFPLIEWGVGQDGCVQIIKRHGLPVPPKSSCYFCPAMKKREVLALSVQRPELFQRAVAIEHAARPNLGVVRGLGRHWSWEELVASDKRRLFPETVETDCLCFDGDQVEREVGIK